MTVLAIDHGTKRVGLAVGSTETGVAVPFRLLEHRGQDALIKEIVAAAASERADQVVVGLPISEDGTTGPQAETVRAFAAALETALDVPVVLEDERLSSREIEAHMQAMGGRKAWQASGLDRDTAAATLFLQTYLDKMKTE